MNNSLSLQKQQTGLILSQKSKKALQSLEPAEQKVVTLALSKKINEIGPIEVVDEFATIITTAFAIAGQKPENDQIFLFADELYSRLIVKYPDTSLEDVRLAIKNGVYGEYGDYYGLNPKSFMQFIKGYKFNEARIKAINKYLDAEAALEWEKEPTPEEKELSKRSYCNTLYTDYLAGKLTYKVVPRLIYQYLVSQELIRLSYDEKTALHERAKQQFAKDLTAGERDQSLGGAIAGMFYVNDPNETIKTIAMQFAVFEYFELMAKARQTVIFEN